MLKPFVQHNRTALIYALIVLGMIAGILTNKVWLLGSAGVMLAAILNLAPGEIAYLMYGMLPFAGVWKFTPHMMSFYTQIEILLMVVFLFRYRKLSRDFILGMVGLTGYLMITMALGFTVNYTEVIKVFCRMILVYFFARLLSGDDFQTITFYYAIGLILSVILSRNAAFYRRVSSCFDANIEKIGTQLISRNVGLIGDPNFFSLCLVLALTMLVVLYNYKRIAWSFWAFACTLLPIGFLTYSKSYFLIISALILLWMVFVLFPKHRIVFLFSVVGVAVFTIFAYSGKIHAVNIIFERIRKYGFSTGRFRTFRIYIDYLLEHPSVLLFGAGLTAEKIPQYSRRVHNILLDSFFKLGISGTMLFISPLAAALRPFPAGETHVLRIVNCIPGICLFVMYMFLPGLATHDLFYNLLLCYGAFKIGYPSAESQNGRLRTRVYKSGV